MEQEVEQKEVKTENAMEKKEKKKKTTKREKEQA
jgi:hypothetical protein